MNKKYRNLLLGLCALVLFTYSVVEEFWPKWFPKTEVVVMNASEQELRHVVVEINSESLSFGNVPAGDYAVMTVRQRVPSLGFVPSQQGTLADGTPIEPRGLNCGDGVPIKRAVYTVRSDGTQWAKIESGNK